MSLLGRLFSYGIFFIQFFEYFYANDFTKQMRLLTESGEFQRPFAPPHPLKARLNIYIFKLLIIIYNF